MLTAIIGHGLVPGSLACLVGSLVGEFSAVQFVAVQIGNDLITILDQRYRTTECGFRSHMADYQANRAARETRVGH